MGVSGGESKAQHDSRYELDGSEVGGGKVDNGEVRDNEVGKKDQKTSKSKKHLSLKKQ